jgi:hypothetical protein
MATLELGSLSEHLEADQVKAVRKALSEVGAPPLPADDHADAVVLDRDIDDDVLTDFFDRLDANDASAEVYLPIDFEDVIDVDGMRVGSLHALILVLESLKEDFFVEEDEDEEEEEEEAELDEDEDEEGSDLFARAAQGRQDRRPQERLPLRPHLTPRIRSGRWPRRRPWIRRAGGR